MTFKPVQFPQPAALPARAPVESAAMRAPGAMPAGGLPAKLPSAPTLPRESELSTFRPGPRFTEMAQKSRSELKDAALGKLPSGERTGVRQFFEGTRDVITRLLQAFPKKLSMEGMFGRKPSGAESVSLRAGRSLGEMANKSGQEMTQAQGKTLAADEKKSIMGYHDGTREVITRLCREFPARLEKATQKEMPPGGPPAPQDGGAPELLQKPPMLPKATPPPVQQAPAPKPPVEQKPPSPEPPVPTAGGGSADAARAPEPPKPKESPAQPKERDAPAQPRPDEQAREAKRGELPAKAPEPVKTEAPEPQARQQAAQERAPQAAREAVQQQVTSQKAPPTGVQAEQSAQQQAPLLQKPPAPLPQLPQQLTQPVLGYLREPGIENPYEDDARPGYYKRMIIVDDGEWESMEGALSGSFSGAYAGDLPEDSAPYGGALTGDFDGLIDGEQAAGAIAGDFEGSFEGAAGESTPGAFRLEGFIDGRFTGKLRRAPRLDGELL